MSDEIENVRLSCPEYEGLFGMMEYEGRRMEGGKVPLRNPIMAPVLEMYGVTLSGLKTKYFTTMWHDGQTYKPWVFVGLPVFGLIGEGNGADVCVAVGGRFINRPEVKATKLHDTVHDIIVEFEYRGFVSFGFDEQGGLTSAYFGVPYYGIYNLMEARHKQSVAEALEDYKPWHSWTLSEVVSRYPWPLVERGEAFVVNGERSGRLWLWDWENVQASRTLFSTQSNLVGVMSTTTGSGILATVGVSRAEVEQLEFPERQMRFGLVDTIRDSWALAKSQLIVEPPIHLPA